MLQIMHNTWLRCADVFIRTTLLCVCVLHNVICIKHQHLFCHRVRIRIFTEITLDILAGQMKRIPLLRPSAAGMRMSSLHGCINSVSLTMVSFSSIRLACRTKLHLYCLHFLFQPVFCSIVAQIIQSFEIIFIDILSNILTIKTGTIKMLYCLVPLMYGFA